MDIHGYFTKKGLRLAAKLAAGSTLKITRVCAGAAETDLTASALSQIQQTLRVGEARCSAAAAVLPVTLAAGLAEHSYVLRELGVYAQDPVEGEILYKVYRLSEPVEISPSSRLVLRFNLEETLSQDLNITVACSPAGLLTEADLEPLQKRVNGTVVPFRTVELAANELSGYIAGLPRLLTEHLYIKVSGSLTASEIHFEGFYGSGTIQVVQTDADAVFKTQLVLDYCSIRMIFNDIHFQCPDSGAIQGSYYGVKASFCKSVMLVNCSFSGGASVKSDYIAIQCDTCTMMIAYGIRAEHCGCVALVSKNAMLSFSAAEDTDALHDNGEGVYVYRGGVMLLFGNTPDTLGGPANLKHGGIIVKPDGTLL